MGAISMNHLLTSRDEIELLVAGVIVGQAFDAHVEFVEAQRKNLAVEINNGIVKAFGG